MNNLESAMLRCLAAIKRVQTWDLRAGRTPGDQVPDVALQELENWYTQHVDRFCDQSGLLPRPIDPRLPRKDQVTNPDVKSVLLPLVAFADEIALAHAPGHWFGRIQSKYLDTHIAGDETFDAYGALLNAYRRNSRQSPGSEAALFASALVLLLGFKGKYQIQQDQNFLQNWIEPSRDIVRKRAPVSALFDPGKVVKAQVAPPPVVHGPRWAGPAILVLAFGLWVFMLCFVMFERSAVDERLRPLAPTRGARP